MIVAPEPDRPGLLRLITQPDHARFAAELLSLWRTGGLPEHPRRDDLLFAAREHDNGWREADAAPRVDRASGRPHDFLSIPREVRIELWQRGTTRYAAERPYAALLIVRHARRIHQDRQDRQGDGAWQSFLDSLEELENELRDTAGAAPEEVDAGARWLDLADLLSLAVCNGWTEPFERHGFRGRFTRGGGGAAGAGLPAGTLHLAPFPLAGATRFRIPCRRLPDRPYEGDADLGARLAQARWEELPVRVAPFSPAP